MTRYSRLSFFPLMVATILCFAGRVPACIPVGGIEPPCSAYWKADAVFVGLISDISKAPPESNGIVYQLLLHFSVEQSYRGVESTEVEVAATTGTDCDTKFQKGERWLMYARRDSVTGRLEVSVRTRLFSRADEDLVYIRGLSESVPESSIIGRAFEYPYTPWQGVRIEIEGNGVKYWRTTDKEGGFTVPALSAGSYLVRGIFPARSGITGFRAPSRIKEGKRNTLVEYQENVEAGRCRYIELFAMKPEGHSEQR